MPNTEAQSTEQKPSWQPVSLADLAGGLYTEPVETDEGADAFAFAPPLLDGKYLATIKINGDPATAVKQIPFPARTLDNGQKLPATTILAIDTEIEVVQFANPELDSSLLNGRSKKFTRRFSTRTKNTAFGKASEAVSILEYLTGEPVKPGTTNGDIMLALQNLLTGETPQVIGVETCWKGGFHRDKNDKKDYGSWKVTGMRNFPQQKDGSYSPVAYVDGEEVHAKAYITRFFSAIPAEDSGE